MSKNPLVVRTSISEELKRSFLFRGTLLAIAGMVPIVLGGMFLSASTLNIWGVPIFFIGGALVVWGLLPYRKICRKETNPAQLTIDENGNLSYTDKGKCLLTIPVNRIKEIVYVRQKKIYGASLSWEERGKIKQMFLPYFSERAINKIKAST